MIAALRRRLTYANLMATIAVFVSLGGSSYAALKITGADIRNGSVKSADVKNGSLRGVDFARGQLPAGARGETGPQGPAGPRGETGPQGPAGTLDVSRFYDRDASDARFLAKGGKAADADRLDGRDGAAYLLGTNGASNGYKNISGCSADTLTDYAVTVTTPSRIWTAGTVEGFADIDGPHSAMITAELLDGDGTVLARSQRGRMDGPNNNRSVHTQGILFAAGESSPYTAQPGSYRLRLLGDNNGLCAGYLQYQEISLSHLSVPAG